MVRGVGDAAGPARIRVLVVEPRRLVRDAFALGIEAEPDLELAAAVASFDEIARDDGFDVALVAPRGTDPGRLPVRSVRIDDDIGMPELFSALRRGEACPVTASPPGPTLTLRERDVLAHLAQGRSGTETAALLGISPKTVENHKQRMFAKLGVQSTAQAVTVAWHELSAPGCGP